MKPVSENALRKSTTKNEKTYKNDAPRGVTNELENRPKTDPECARMQVRTPICEKASFFTVFYEGLWLVAVFLSNLRFRYLLESFVKYRR